MYIGEGKARTGPRWRQGPHWASVEARPTPGLGGGKDNLTLNNLNYNNVLQSQNMVDMSIENRNSTCTSC